MNPPALSSGSTKILSAAARRSATRRRRPDTFTSSQLTADELAKFGKAE